MSSLYTIPEEVTFDQYNQRRQIFNNALLAIVAFLSYALLAIHAALIFANYGITSVIPPEVVLVPSVVGILSLCAKILSLRKRTPVTCYIPIAIGSGIAVIILDTISDVVFLLSPLTTEEHIPLIYRFGLSLSVNIALICGSITVGLMEICAKIEKYRPCDRLFHAAVPVKIHV